MCHQECALYGDLVLWLRDQAAQQLACQFSEEDVEAACEQLDTLIHDWFFTPQDRLHGCAPRDLIWAEMSGQPNPIHPERLDEFFGDDCAVCQAEKAELQAALESGAEHGWRWCYDDGGFPLIAGYDPEGWDARWAAEEAEFEAWRAGEHPPAAPDYQPPPSPSPEMDAQTFLEFLRHPWLDPALRDAAQTLAAHCDVPLPPVPGAAEQGLRYRRVTAGEAASLAAGLSRQGVDVGHLLAHIKAWPYQNVALDWLSAPELNVALLCQVIEQELAPDDVEAQIHFRQHRDFVLALSQVIPPAARLWMEGWLDALAYAAFAEDEG